MSNAEKRSDALIAAYRDYFGPHYPPAQDNLDNLASAIATYNRIYGATTPTAELVEALRRLRIAEGALIDIAHTCTEDSHGNTKDYPVSYYRDAARRALSHIGEE